MRRSLMILALASCIGAAGCGYSGVRIVIGEGAPISATGPMVTRNLAWTGSNALSFGVPADITFTQGPTASLVVEGPKNVVDRVRMDGDTVAMAPGRYHFHDARPLKITAVAPGVEDLGVGLSGRLVTPVSLRQERLRIRVSSSAEADVKAEVSDLKIAVSTSARLAARGSAKAVNVSVSSSSRADLDFGAVTSLDADVSTSGRLTSKGGTGRVDVGVSSSGSADLEVQATSLDGRVNTSGRLTARGRADQVNLSVSSSASADLDEVAILGAKVEASTSGRATLSPKETLEASATSSARITVRSNPPILRTNTGASGRVDVASRQAALQ